MHLLNCFQFHFSTLSESRPCSVSFFETWSVTIWEAGENSCQVVAIAYRGPPPALLECRNVPGRARSVVSIFSQTVGGLTPGILPPVGPECHCFGAFTLLHEQLDISMCQSLVYMWSFAPVTACNIILTVICVFCLTWLHLLFTDYSWFCMLYSERYQERSATNSLASYRL